MPNDSDKSSPSSSPSDSSSKPSIGYWQRAKNYIRQTADDQALERLMACRELEQVRQDCLDRKYERRVKDTSSGLRIARLYEFEEVDNPRVKSLCQQEEHLVWTCRALALQCGSHVSKVKACFEEAGVENVIAQKTNRAYEGAKKGPCWHFQSEMGKCIQENADMLAQRLDARQSDK
jgi:hypothetical protein